MHNTISEHSIETTASETQGQFDIDATIGLLDKQTQRKEDWNPWSCGNRWVYCSF